VSGNGETGTGSSTGQAGVSIIIPCYNYGRFLEEAVESALAQTLPAAEILIVDDGSTDDSLEVARALAALPGVRLIEQTNQGAVATFNAGIRASAGEYFVVLSADDRLDPYFLERTVPRLRERPEVAYAYTAYRMFGARRRSLPALPYSARRLRLRPYISATALVRRSAFDEVGGFPTTMAGGVEDWDFFLSLAQRGRRAVAIPEILFHYRQHGGGNRNALTFRQVLAVRSRIYRNHAPLYRLPLLPWLALTVATEVLLRVRAAPRALAARLHVTADAPRHGRVCLVGARPQCLDLPSSRQATFSGPFTQPAIVPETSGFGAGLAGADQAKIESTIGGGSFPALNSRGDDGAVQAKIGSARAGMKAPRLRHLFSGSLYQRAALYHAVGQRALLAAALAASLNRAFLIYQPEPAGDEPPGATRRLGALLEYCLLWRIDAVVACRAGTRISPAQRRLQATILNYDSATRTGAPNLNIAAQPRTRLFRLYRDFLGAALAASAP
jgi:glycosyltransferase involved in cell wall biosynthesis